MGVQCISSVRSLEATAPYLCFVWAAQKVWFTVNFQGNGFFHDFFVARLGACLFRLFCQFTEATFRYQQTFWWASPIESTRGIGNSGIPITIPIMQPMSPKQLTFLSVKLVRKREKLITKSRVDIISCNPLVTLCESESSPQSMSTETVCGA